ncbi:hypothetical protein CERZMDRAFT_83916 [Cercospora zeae-maydis SCOH1-5]|uniref:Uncharacterized protein n=1 Tax=Cercospora zeae-maydis SCOH1-5 TaxID=717836 RepID=A0A6A6FHZ8_9PEZI|nr:hypothetical protein CERZMDRAFT_83916 [Cercospora zeae-maydis SCOH1-5]
MDKNSKDVAQVDLHSIEVDLIRFDKLRVILRGRQHGEKHTACEVLDSLEACMEEYERVFAEYSDRLSGSDMQILKAEAASLEELIRAEKERKDTARDHEGQKSSSLEASHIQTSNLARNANDNSEHGHESDIPDAKDVPATKSYEDGTQPSNVALDRSPKRSSIHGSSRSKMGLPANFTG